MSILHKLYVITVIFILTTAGVTFAADQSLPPAKARKEPKQTFTESSPFTLDQIYRATLAQSESLKIDEAGIRFAEARYQEAVAAIYPKIHFILTERLRNDSSTNSSGNSDFGQGSNSGFSGTRKDRLQGALNITQPLFSGFRDFYLADAAQAEIESRKLLTMRAKELLFEEVAKLYYQIVLYQKDLVELDLTQAVLEKRIQEIEEFVKLGKEREGAKYSAQADIADNQTTKSQIKGLLQASKEMLVYLSGIRLEDLKLEANIPNLRPEPLNNYLELGINRLDILAASQNQAALAHQLKATEREKWPSLSLQGNYYPIESPDTDRSADLMLQLDVPVFESGRIDARIAQKQATLRSEQLRSEELKRKAESEIRIAYANYEALFQEHLRLNELVDAIEKDYTAQKADYSLGVVTNLEVLQSIRELQNAKRRLLRVRIDEQISKIKLQVAAGDVIPGSGGSNSTIQ
ncbi:TolC family protein [bacterium]|nr:TolC family protein [bacterium]